MHGVVTYYLLNLLHRGTPHVSTNVTRECIAFNKLRADICAAVYNNKFYSNVIDSIHNASKVVQINGVPSGVHCAVDQKSVPHSESGVQLILTVNDKREHIVVQRKYQRLLYNYWKLRNFPEFIQTQLRVWLINEPWYLPKTHTVNFVVNKVFASSFCDNMYKHFTQAVHEISDTVDFIDTTS